jgi:hypothetical protein
MGVDDGFKKRLKTVAESISEAVCEGQNKIKVLDLTGTDIAIILNASDDEIESKLQEQNLSFAKHFVRVRTARGTSEAYMRSSAELKNWLRRTNLN